MPLLRIRLRLCTHMIARIPTLAVPGPSLRAAYREVGMKANWRYARRDSAMLIFIHPELLRLALLLAILILLRW